MRSHFSKERPCWLFETLLSGELPTLTFPFSLEAVSLVTGDPEVDRGRTAELFPCPMSGVSAEPPRKGAVSTMPFELVRAWCVTTCVTLIDMGAAVGFPVMVVRGGAVVAAVCCKVTGVTDALATRSAGSRVAETLWREATVRVAFVGSR